MHPILSGVLIALFFSAVGVGFAGMSLIFALLGLRASRRAARDEVAETSEAVQRAAYKYDNGLGLTRPK